MIRIALPNNGSLSEEAAILVKAAGYNARREAKELSVTDAANDIEFLFLRPRDIAVYVGKGIVDLGITGRDLLCDSGVEAAELLPLGFGKSRFCYAVPNESTLTVEQLDGRRIASSYPNIVKADMARRGFNCPVTKLDGAVEISIRLGVADAIADVVESGSTMRQAGLKVIGEPVMYSEAVIIARSAERAQEPQFRTFLQRIQGILTARNYVIVEYDVPAKHLAEVCEITHGVESPTVSPLSKPEWFAVKSLIPRKGVNDIIDRLVEHGARGILVMDIRTCRMHD